MRFRLEKCEDRTSQRSFSDLGGFLYQGKRNVILCDFDGTITIQDTAEWILDKHAKGDWRELDDYYVQGKISLLDCMRQQFALVSTKRSIILDELDKEIDIRDGFTNFVDVCLANGAKFVIVSAGIDFVIEHFLKKLGIEKKVSVYSASTYDEDGHLAFRFPPLIMPDSRTFKDDAVSQWRKNGYNVTYFGDGVPDTEACAISDYRFAVKCRRLESELTKRGLPFMSFVDFGDVIPHMKRVLE